MWIVLLLLIPFVLLMLVRVLKPVFMLLFLRHVGRQTLKDVGKRALDRQPDLIRLTPRSDMKWKDAAKLQALEGPLKACGFDEVGTYDIEQLRGVVVRLLVNPRENAAAAVYEHPKAEMWLDLFTHYLDGTTFTITSTKEHGLEKRTGCVSIHAPGVNSGTMYRRLIKERPKDGIKLMTAGSVCSAFEEAYAMDMSWRKNKGLSVREVANVAMNRP